MPYNISPKAVERWKHELDNLLSGQPFTWTTDAPHKLAYRLREAIAAAKACKIEPYASIDYQFTQTSTMVIATPRESLVQGAKQPDAVFDGAVTEYDVISAATTAKNDALVFPNFLGEITAIQRWAEAKGFTITEDPLTLRRKP